MQSYSFNCGVCHNTFDVSVKSYLAAGSLICANCVHTLVVPKFNAALDVEINYPPFLNGNFLSLDEFPGAFDSGFVSRYRRREAEYNTPSAERSFCSHSFLASCAPLKAEATSNELALTPFQIEAAQQNGLKVVTCGAFLPTQASFGPTSRECHHCRGLICAKCVAPLGPGRTHRCPHVQLVIEAPVYKHVTPTQEFRLCPNRRCRRAIHYDGSFLSPCKFCKTNLCFKCGKRIIAGDGHYNGTTCTRWPGRKGVEDAKPKPKPSVRTAEQLYTADAASFLEHEELQRLRNLSLDGSPFAKPKTSKIKITDTNGNEINFNKAAPSQSSQKAPEHHSKFRWADDPESEPEFEPESDLESGLESIPEPRSKSKSTSGSDSNSRRHAENQNHDQDKGREQDDDDAEADRPILGDLLPRLEGLFMANVEVGHEHPPRLWRPVRDSGTVPEFRNHWLNLSTYMVACAENLVTVMQAELAEVWTDLEPHRFPREVRIVSMLSVDVSMAIQIMFHMGDFKDTKQRADALETFKGLQTQIAGALEIDRSLEGIMKHLPSMAEALSFIDRFADGFVADVQGDGKD